MDIVRIKKKLTNDEFSRIIILAGYTQHSSTAIFAMATATAALEIMNNPEPFRTKLLDTLVNNLKSSDSNVRQTSIASLGNAIAKDRIDSILPFIRSNDPQERNSAKNTLIKLGFKFPADPKPTE